MSAPREIGTQAEQPPPEQEGEQAAGANKNVVSREAIENERPQNAFEARKNVPGVTNSDT
jgi:hypothetical protein